MGGRLRTDVAASGIRIGAQVHDRCPFAAAPTHVARRKRHITRGTCPTATRVLSHRHVEAW